MYVKLSSSLITDIKVKYQEHVYVNSMMLCVKHV